MLILSTKQGKMGFSCSSFTFSFLFFFSVFSFGVSDSALVPAMYVFGDSLIDVGNNNHLKFSLIKANFPHNGVDFPNKQRTGRFCNGKIAMDFLAENVGLPLTPPYLSLVNENGKTGNTDPFMTGISFASGGAGVFNETNNESFNHTQAIPLTQQIELYKSVYQYLVDELGWSAAQTHLSQSLFPIVIGSNDLWGYYESSELQNKSTPQQYVNLMASTLKKQLTRLYMYGARKYVVVGVGLLGCVPSQRKNSESGDCSPAVNALVEKYSIRLESMLRQLQNHLPHFVYSYFDSFTVISEYVKNPSLYGFVEIKAACCGIGKLRAEFNCVPFASLCRNRTNHLFWDLYHPSQEVYRRFANYMFDGPLKYTRPINVKQLAAATAAATVAAV